MQQITVSAFFWIGGRVEFEVRDVAALQTWTQRRRCCSSKWTILYVRHFDVIGWSGRPLPWRLGLFWREVSCLARLCCGWGEGNGEPDRSGRVGHDGGGITFLKFFDVSVTTIHPPLSDGLDDSESDQEE